MKKYRGGLTLGGKEDEDRRSHGCDVRVSLRQGEVFLLNASNGIKRSAFAQLEKKVLENRTATSATTSAKMTMSPKKPIRNMSPRLTSLNRLEVVHPCDKEFV